MHVVTPTIESTPLTRILGRPVWLKLDNTQPTGSFKLRGIGALCTHLVARGARHLVASSGGNAGLAAAWAGRKLGTPVTLVVPLSTPRFMRDRIEAEGAQVQVHGAVWDEAHARALALVADDPNAALVHPFDDPVIWTGHSTLVTELAEAATQLQSARRWHHPAAVVVAVGGGGLFCGVAQGMQAVGWDQVPIVAVETRGAHCFEAAIAAGKPVDIGGITSVAKSLGARTVATEALAWTKRRPVASLVVTDEQALRACDAFLDDHRMLVEPACGAALAAVYERAEVVAGLDAADEAPVVVVVCGGAAARPTQAVD